MHTNFILDFFLSCGLSFKEEIHYSIVNFFLGYYATFILPVKFSND